MTHENNNLSFRQNNDAEQIDLIDVLTQIWRGKWIIALFIVFSVIIAGLYIAVAKEKWTSVAVVSSPDASQIASYTSAISMLSNDNKFDITGTQQRVISRFNTAFPALGAAIATESHLSGLLSQRSATKTGGVYRAN